MPLGQFSIKINQKGESHHGNRTLICCQSGGGTEGGSTSYVHSAARLITSSGLPHYRISYKQINAVLFLFFFFFFPIYQTNSDVWLHRAVTVQRQCFRLIIWMTGCINVSTKQRVTASDNVGFISRTHLVKSLEADLKNSLISVPWRAAELLPKSVRCKAKKSSSRSSFKARMPFSLIKPLLPVHPFTNSQPLLLLCFFYDFYGQRAIWNTKTVKALTLSFMSIEG